LEGGLDIWDGAGDGQLVVQFHGDEKTDDQEKNGKRYQCEEQLLHIMQQYR
jgi:hypothetical protein